jgi:hypothetical protein
MGYDKSKMLLCNQGVGGSNPKIIFILSKFFFVGLVFPFSQLPMVISLTPIILPISTRNSLCSNLHFLIPSPKFCQGSGGNPKSNYQRTEVSVVWIPTDARPVVRQRKSMSSYEGTFKQMARISLPYFRGPRHSLITLNLARLIPCIPSWPSCGHFRLTFARSHIDETCSKTSKMSLGGATIKVLNESTKGREKV